PPRGVPEAAPLAVELKRVEEVRHRPRDRGRAPPGRRVVLVKRVDGPRERERRETPRLRAHAVTPPARSTSSRYASKAAEYSMTRAPPPPSASPHPARRRRWKPISIPEVIPPAVTIRPASTTRARLTRQAGAISARRSIGTLPRGPDSTWSGSFRLVAGRSSSRPMRA